MGVAVLGGIESIVVVSVGREAVMRMTGYLCHDIGMLFDLVERRNG